MKEAFLWMMRRDRRNLLTSLRDDHECDAREIGRRFLANHETRA